MFHTVGLEWHSVNPSAKTEVTGATRKGTGKMAIKRFFARSRTVLIPRIADHFTLSLLQILRISTVAIDIVKCPVAIPAQC